MKFRPSEHWQKHASNCWKIYKYASEAFDRGLKSSDDCVLAGHLLFDAKSALADTLEAKIAIADDSLKSAKTALELSKAREAAGQVTPFDVLVAEFDVSDAQARLERLKKEAVNERELSEKKVKVLEIKLEGARIYFDRGLADTFDVTAARVQLSKAKMKLFETPEARHAYAKEEQVGTAKFLNLCNAYEATGRITKLHAWIAEADSLAAEIEVARLNKDAAGERALTEKTIKTLERAVDAAVISFGRGLIDSGKVIAVRERLCDAKMDAAVTPEERLAIAKDQLLKRTEFFETCKDSETKGYVTKRDVVLAQLSVVELQIKLCGLKK